MTPSITVGLEREVYHPGQLLSGGIVVKTAGTELRTLELSVLWHTQGRGDEDLGIVHFEEWPDKQGQPFDCSRPQGFSTVLPRTPLSYDGVLVKVCWCVRVRTHWTDGTEMVSEIPFVLGSADQNEDA